MCWAETSVHARHLRIIAVRQVPAGIWGGGGGSEEFMASCSSQKHALGSAGRAPRPTCTALSSPLGSRRVQLFVPVRLRLRNLLKVTEGALGLEPGPGTSDLCCVMPLSVLGEGNK